MISLKNEKKKKIGKIKKILITGIISAGLMTSCGEFKANEGGNEYEITDEDKYKTEEINEKNDVNETDKENSDLDKEINDEEIIKNDEEKNDEEEIIEEEENEELLKEFEKECFNPFYIGKILSDECKEEIIFTNNGVECNVNTFACRVKENYDKLVKMIKSNPSQEQWIRDKATVLNTSVIRLFMATMYGSGIHKIVDLPDKKLSNNDFIEGYVTEFTVGNTKIYVKDKFNPSVITITDLKGNENDLVETYMDFEGVSFIPISLRSGWCIYPDNENLTRDLLQYSDVNFVTGTEAYDHINNRNCEDKYKEQLNELINEVLEEE
jgi:hypothetical protein